MSREYFKYEQRTGRFAVVNREAVLSFIGRGYSGHGAAINDPTRENLQRFGPIPCGLWHVSSAIFHPKLGPLAFPLAAEDERGTIIPAPYGRSGFFIHGDNASRNRTASSGCIVLDRDVRMKIREWQKRGVNTLLVISG